MGEGTWSLLYRSPLGIVCDLNLGIVTIVKLIESDFFNLLIIIPIQVLELSS